MCVCMCIYIYIYICICMTNGYRPLDRPEARIAGQGKLLAFPHAVNNQLRTGADRGNPID